MVLTQLQSDGLDGLCSKEQLHLLNAIDSLRSQGISHYISLPQIIVCGDQSSGKSSVLEAISGVSFPVKSNLCTRFPTELILRKAPGTSVKVRIVPHHSRSEEEKKSLSGFEEELSSFQDLPSLIENAQAAMGIMTLGKAFSKDLLRIEISGPDRPHLTIVDLPGLIHSETKHQSASDIDLITDVVKSYMKEPRSVILAVVSAKNDFANQIVLKLARKADPKGTRTLGVITKPDTLVPGSGNERMFISLAMNMDVEFRLGWHAVRNRDTDSESWSLEERDAKEAEFFSGSAWASLPHTSTGIKALRDRLSKLLLHQIASELPNLMSEISEKSAQCQAQLDRLGQPRTTVHEQRLYLVQISQSFQMLAQAAVDGNYNNPFFGDVTTALGYEKRIRAIIQNLNRNFSKDLEQSGQLYKIVSKQRAARTEVNSSGQLWSIGDSVAKLIPSDTHSRITRETFIDKVVAMINRNRGRELPGMFNPMVVGDLFREQSSPWKDIVNAHVKRAWDSASLFVLELVKHVADEASADVILNTVVEPKLKVILTTLLTKTSSLLQPHQSGHPITYNHYMTDTLQKIRLEREKERVEKAVLTIFNATDLDYSVAHCSSSPRLRDLIDHIVSNNEPNMERFAASEALDYMDAYYKVALKRFIDDIAVEVIETCLVAALGQVFTPMTVAMMPNTEVTSIAGETKEGRIAREDLERKLLVLENGIKTCKQFSGFRLTDVGEDGDEVDNEEPTHDSDEYEARLPERSVNKVCEEILEEAVPRNPIEEVYTGIAGVESDPVNETAPEVIPAPVEEYYPDHQYSKKSKKKNKKRMPSRPDPVLQPEPETEPGPVPEDSLSTAYNGWELCVQKIKERQDINMETEY